jgi:hypothetical protein
MIATRLLSVALVLVVAVNYCRAEEEADCKAPARWFELPPLESDYHEPTRGKECEFYQFAVQTFLYIIQPNDYETWPKFLSYHTPDELFGQFAAPRFPKRGSFSKTNSYRLTLTPRLEKRADPESLNSVLQAGSHSTLVDQNGRAVYYAQHVNKGFEDFVMKYIRDPATGTIDPSKLASIPENVGFPKGCIELKSSWKIAVPGDEKKFFTIEAGVAPFKVAADGENLTIDTDPDHLRTEQVALVGIHVVATTENHAEFIWATFEHKENAPQAEFAMGDNDPVHAKNWTFYRAGTPLKNCNLGNRKKVRFKNGNTQGPKDQLLKIDGGDEQVTQVCRSFAFGAAPEDASDVAAIDDEIDDLNKSVASQMPARFGVWRNYEFRGAVWIDDPAEFKSNRDFFKMDEDTNPNAPAGNGGNPQQYGKGTVLLGEHRLSNPTMETFTQGRVSQASSQTDSNCFSCHRTISEQPSNLPDGADPSSFEMPPKLVNISHIIVNGVVYPKQEAAAAEHAKGH